MIKVVGKWLFLLALMLTMKGEAATDMNQTKKEVVILLGPPGSGKGTQAVRLSKELHLPHISTGDLFRENLKKETELGKKAKAFMEAGNLVPDELVLDMLFQRVSLPDCKDGYLLDGVPRTLEQAKALDAHFGKDVHLTVLNLEVNDDVIIKRASGRRNCQGCGKIYNLYFSPPQKEGTCDVCSGELTQRADDQEDVVRQRLVVYHKQTKPLEAYYKEKGVLTTVDGSLSPDEVFKNLMDSFYSRRK